ncbi:MAG: hypothetical protein HMLKMBBP_02651 [Planctomycetes bacterium]|nr:hypothetical protein [Planctomycetota bacterium]
MRKVLLFSVLLVLGLAGSQFLSSLGGAEPAVRETVRLLTTACLGFVMIHVGYEFDIDKRNLRAYVADYGIAATAAAFPWLFAAGWFVWAMGAESWESALLTARFAAPTSAGVLFAMLAAAGLSATWLFRKARILAIFDDLDTVLLMIPLKVLIVGWRWQLGVVVAAMAVLVWIAWRWLHALRLPVGWPWVIGYSVALTAACETVYRGSKLLDDAVPIHIEILLPAFVLGCVMARPAGADPHSDDAREGHQEGPETPEEQRVATIVSAAFMVLVGLSMPRLGASEEMGWGAIAAHVAVVTVLSNLGKMFPLFCYRSEASWRERLALCVGMWPRGEVGAGVLVVSIGYGIGGPMVTVATFSLALNLLLTGVFIAWAKSLLAADARLRAAASPPARA